MAEIGHAARTPQDRPQSAIESLGFPIGIYTTFHVPPSDNDLSVFPLLSALTFGCLNATINRS